ncbi:MAG: response regulator [Pedobacter sp.]
MPIIMATIVIQENDSAVLDVLILALQAEGHRSIGLLGSCPLAMSNVVKRNIPDIVLVDYRNRDNVGKTLLAVIKKLKAKLPVIALSCDLNISKIAVQLGFDGFIRKPFDLDEIFETINNILRPSAHLDYQA